MKAELYLAYRYLFRGRRKHTSFISAVSSVGVALGVATLIIVISVMNGFDRDLMEKLLRFNYHITIESFQENNLAYVKKMVKDWPEVKSSSFAAQTQVFAKLDNLIFPLAVRGVDFTSPEEKKFFYRYLKEETGSEGFFIGEGLRERFHLESKIEFYRLSKEIKLSEGRIRGVFRVGLYDFDNNYLITDLAEAKSLSPNYLIFLGLRLKNPFSAAKIKERIEKKLPKGVFATTWVESNRTLFSALKLEKITMFIILSLIILVASFNIFATLTVKVVEKTKDIGILKALGFSARRILLVFSLQGLILGFLGTVSGTFAGVGLSLLLKHYPFIKLPQEIYYIEYLPVTVVTRDIILIVSLGLILSFLSSLLPALRASKLSACEALRYE